MRDRVQLPPQRQGEFDASAPERNRVLYEMLNWHNDPPNEIMELLAVYYGMVRFIDDGVGQILDTLERLGLREKTIVVFCSDHGDFMGEHGMQCKGGVFYDCLTHVPLVVAWPGHAPANVEDGSVVNLVDIVPTLLKLQGLEVPRAMHGQPLPIITDAPPRNATFAEYGAGGPPFRLSDLEKLAKPWGRRTLIESLQWREAEGRRKMVRTPSWKYVHDPMGDLDELYDLANDPWELTNVATQAKHQAVMGELRALLADWMIRTEDAKPVPLPQAIA
jgi:arylsulfatase A-like enzyme